MMKVTKKQTGTVLVLSLIILTVLTLISVTSLKTSITDERMSGNLRDSEIALQAAESAMREAFNTIDGFGALNVLNGTNGLLNFADPEPDFFAAATWDNSTTNTYTESPTLGDTSNQLLASQPRRVIKFIGTKEICGPCLTPGSPNCGPSCNPRTFRVTAHGIGLTPNTTRTIQGFYQSPQP